MNKIKITSDYFIKESLKCGRKSPLTVNLGPYGCDAPLNILYLEFSFDYIEELLECFEKNITKEFTIVIPKDFKLSYKYNDVNEYKRTLKYNKKRLEWK